MKNLFRTLMALLVAALLAGCAVTRSGILSDAANRHTIPISVVIERDSVRVSGTDPLTGELLTGLLVPDEEQRRAPSDFGGISPPVGGGSGAGPGGTAPIGVGSTGPTTLNLVGSLQGDRGARLRCVVVLRQTLRLTGEGVCRSVSSESDARYLLRF